MSTLKPSADMFSAENDVYSYHLVLFSNAEEMNELWLTDIPEGFFRFTDNPDHRFVSIMSKNGQWTAVCNRPAFFRDVPLEQCYEIPLQNNQLLHIDYDDCTYALFVEKVSRAQLVFRNYHICSDVEVTIGNHSSNAIYYNSSYASPKHAAIHRSAGRWTIRDCGSNLGTFVNGTKVDYAELQTGDMVCIMGLRIIIGPSFLAVNNGNGKVVVNPQILQESTVLHSGFSRYYDQENPSSTDKFFNRRPRKRFDIPQKTITIEGPPMSMDQKQVPMMLRMGSSMVMGGAAALAGNFMTLISSVLFPFLSSKYTDKQRQEYEQLRLAKYTEYLESKRLEIESACQEEQDLLNRKYPAICEVINVVNQKENLWERRPVDSDFLQVRLGTGTRLLTTAIEYPAKRFALETDKLEEDMYRLAEEKHDVKNAPIVLSLTDTKVIGMLGQRQVVIEYVRQLILQIVALHSYDEVKTVFLLNNEDLLYLEDIRYLPHTWDDQRSIRFIATNEAEAYKLGEYIQGQIADGKDEKRDLQKILKKHPYYLIFAMDKKLFECHEVMKDILQSDCNMGATVITVFDDLPKESQKILSLESKFKNVCTSVGIDGGEDTNFSLDDSHPLEIKKAMRILANTRLKTAAQEQELPKMITFLEMFGAGRIEQLNPLKRWQESNPIKSLAAPVGVGADGSLFMLDLHEKRQGPHGLIAGMTGSGKSEFIITYILSMAINYHPDEVAFVLIDYKGGGLADAFDNPRTGVKLPHLAGTITNLDGASIQRSLMSIESELVRRQKVFSEVSKSFEEGSMNIYTYQKLYRERKVSDPMPHLFIISDEFAELKQQQPEFMDKLISAARIGRSLGIHLILATQKPSGVVNDQIRSNTKFRVCLRVQERSDSMDMLKRPEAAELTDTGRFYLQVGYNEYFALGQSAWCGAPYEPQDSVVVQHDDAIEFLDITGQIVTKAKPKVKKVDSGMKQIGAVVQYLSNLAAAHGIRSRQLWQPELPKVLDLEEINPSHGDSMSVCLGLLDSPEDQQQFSYWLDFKKCGNLLVVGNGGTGKTVMLHNILYSLSKQLSPQEFNFYVLDYSSRMIKLFKLLPHCGAVLQEEDEASLDEFFNLINSLLTERKRLFSQLEVDSFEAAKEQVELPLILVVIDNITGLAASKKGENHMYKLQSYLKGSANYGIKYVITCSHLNEVSSRIRQELGEIICLHMKDKYDYAEALGCKVTYIPPEIPGRGLVKWMDRPLELQSAILCAGRDEAEQTRYLKDKIRVLCGKYGNQANARQMPVYSETATYEDFSRQFKSGRIPLGYSKQTGKPIALPLKQFSALSIYFGGASGRKTIVGNMLYAAEKEHMETWVVKRKENSLFEEKEYADQRLIQKPAKVFDLTQQSLADFRNLLSTESTTRNVLLQEYCQREGITGESDKVYRETFDYIRTNTKPIMLLFENYADFCTSVDLFSSIVYDKIISTAQTRNIYAIACFEPEDYKQLTSRTLYYGFNPRANILLFGGHFDKQEIYPLQSSVVAGKTLPFNAGLMHYQNQLYPILMPCGEIDSEINDEDEQSIF